MPSASTGHPPQICRKISRLPVIGAATGAPVFILHEQANTIDKLLMDFRLGLQLHTPSVPMKPRLNTTESQRRWLIPSLPTGPRQLTQLAKARRKSLPHLSRAGELHHGECLHTVPEAG